MRKPFSLVPAGAVLLVLAGLIFSCQENKPVVNVLLITLDTTRADRLGCYGYDKPLTPVLDRLAAESVVFDMAIAQAAVTPVSHASILTGLDPYHHGLRVLHGNVANRLAEKHETLAEVWERSGGQTAAFVSAYPVGSDFGLHQGFELFDERYQQTDGNASGDQGTVNTDESQRRADETVDAALAWLGADRDRNSPLLMWLHFFDPHDPRVVPPDEVQEKFVPAGQDRRDWLLSVYDCEVFYMDSQIGRIVEAFKAEGLWEETVVVVVGDHGEGLGQHDWWSHGILYQEQIRVPLIVRVPGMKTVRRVGPLVRTIDIMPTLLETAGVEEANWPRMDGASLKAALKTGRTGGILMAYSDSVNILSYGRQDDPAQYDHKHDKLYCIMQAGYKLIFHQLKPDESEFYNLNKDPGELNNLAPSKPYQMRVFMKYLDSLKALSPIRPGMTPTDLERIEKLKGLGYGN